MEDKIFDIVTDIYRDEITKQEAIDRLTALQYKKSITFAHGAMILQGSTLKDAMQQIKSKLSGLPETQVIEGELLITLKREL